MAWMATVHSKIGIKGKVIQTAVQHQLLCVICDYISATYILCKQKIYHNNLTDFSIFLAWSINMDRETKIALALSFLTIMIICGGVGLGIYLASEPIKGKIVVFIIWIYLVLTFGIHIVYKFLIWISGWCIIS